VSRAHGRAASPSSSSAKRVWSLLSAASRRSSSRSNGELHELVTQAISGKVTHLRSAAFELTERALLSLVVAHVGENQTRLAEILGITRTTARQLLRKLAPHAVLDSDSKSAQSPSPEGCVIPKTHRAVPSVPKLGL